MKTRDIWRLPKLSVRESGLVNPISRYSKIKWKAKSEANAGSAFPQVMRESVSGNTGLRIKFLEAGSSKNKYRVILIKEGLGNFGDNHYYTRKALEMGAKIFDGKKCYGDHPSKTEQEDRPERSVEEIIGWFSECKFEESSDGQGMIVGWLNILPGKAWVSDLLESALEFQKEFPDKDLAGLSINAFGDSERAPIEEVQRNAPSACKEKLAQALSMGITEVKLVNTISDAISCDLVTEAGAGGKVLSAA